MHVALNVPAVFGLGLDPGAILSACRHLGVQTIALASSTVEAWLGKPSVAAWLLEMPDNGFETGALPLEEEILQDEIDLARQTLQAQVREWRGSVSLAPLARLRQDYAAAGITIAILDWTDLSTCSDDEVDYALTLTQALGASAVTVGLVAGAPRRLARFADRHGMRIGFQNTAATRAADLAAALTHSPHHAVSLDLRAWWAGGQGSPLPFLRQYHDRVLVVHADAADVGEGPDGEAVGEILQDIRTNGWPLPIALGLEHETLDGADRLAMIARAIDHGLKGLRLST